MKVVREHIENFTRGGNLYKKLGIGGNREFKPGDGIELIEPLYFIIDGTIRLKKKSINFREKGDPKQKYFSKTEMLKTVTEREFDEILSMMDDNNRIKQMVGRDNNSNLPGWQYVFVQRYKEGERVYLNKDGRYFQGRLKLRDKKYLNSSIIGIKWVLNHKESYIRL